MPEEAAPARRGAELAVLLAVWAVAAVVVCVAAFDVVSPRRFVDEFLYWALAKNIAAGDGASWRGASLGVGSWLYPVVIAPAFKLAGSVSAQYELVKAINAALICAVVFPVYVGARWFVTQRLALVAAAFAIAVPALNYAGIVGTESLAYPLATAAFVAMLNALARPGVRPAAWAVGLTLVALLVRIQFALLVPIFAMTLLLVAAMREPGTRVAYLREQRALITMLGSIVVLAVLYVIVRGSASLGIYAAVFHQGPLTLDAVWFWLKAFSADVYLLCGIVPAIATFGLFGSRANRRDPLIGSLAALALVAALAFVAQMTWFSAITPFHWREQHIFYERYMFYLGPLFFIGLVASFGRVSWKAAAISLGLSMLIVSGMQSDAINVPFSIDAFGQAYLGFYLDQHDGLLPHIGMVLAGLTLILGLAYVAASLPESHEAARRWGRALAILLPLFVLVISQAKAWTYQQIYADSVRAREPSSLDWVARATQQPVAMLIASDSDPTTFYQSEFWNPNIERAYISKMPPVNSRIVYSPNCLLNVAPNGAIRAGIRPGCTTVPDAWLVESDSFSMHLRHESTRVNPSTGKKSTLMVSRGPAQVLSMIGGRNVATGLVERKLEVRTYSLAPGTVRIEALAPRGAAVIVNPNGAKTSLARGGRVTLEYAIRRGNQLTSWSVLGEDGGPSAIRVREIQIREGDGIWRSVR
ncbi:MAG: hypothetical protein JHC98_06580 [Thermoleophilaceae bacterium]|nr:hypothetical protein [Thermoleophilaceae bacterium]